MPKLLGSLAPDALLSIKHVEKAQWLPYNSPRGSVGGRGSLLNAAPYAANMLQSWGFVRGTAVLLSQEPFGSHKVTEQMMFQPKSKKKSRWAFGSCWSDALLCSSKTPQRDCVCLYTQPDHAAIKCVKKEGSELRERQTFLSGQLYFSKTSSYISVAPSVTSMMAWLHTLPRPVRLNCKKTGKGASETQRTEADMNSETVQRWNSVVY